MIVVFLFKIVCVSVRACVYVCVCLCVEVCLCVYVSVIDASRSHVLSVMYFKSVCYRCA